MAVPDGHGAWRRRSVQRLFCRSRHPDCECLARVDVAHHNTHVADARRLEAIAPCHCLGLHVAEWIEAVHLLHGVFIPIWHFGDGAVGIVVHFGDAYGAALLMVGHLEAQQFVVEAEDVAFALVVDDAGMIAVGAGCRTHDVAFFHPRAVGVELMA